MEQVTVLVVDDSAFMRRAIRDVLERDPVFKVVGTARSGEDALAKIPALRPQLVTMDLQMPGMGGVQAAAQIVEQWQIPVVVISSLTHEGASASLDALQAGAVDVFLKEEVLRVGGGQPGPAPADFYLRLQASARARVQAKFRRTPVTPARPAAQPRVRPDLVIIGCSTGGPAALQTVLPAFTKPLPVPLLVVQHMPAGFTRHLAERLDHLCAFHVKEAEDGERPQPGIAYVAPAGWQTLLENTPAGVVFRIRPSRPDELPYRPSVDVTLSSSAAVFGSRVLAVILTGMGKDGLRGCQRLKEQGGSVIAEAPETCVVYGMPKAVYEAGYADVQAPLGEIAQHILQRL